MTDQGHAKLATKIQALLAQAEGEAAAGNEAARDTFLEKAAALQLKYAIDDAMLSIGAQSKDELAYADFCTESNTPLIKAKRILINGLAAYNRGKAMMLGESRQKKDGGWRWDNRAKVRVYAHQSDLDFITMLYNSLILQMQSMMAVDERRELANGIPSGPVGHTPTNRQAWRVSYAYGWVDRVLLRINWAAQRNEQRAEDSQPGTALVLRDRTQLVKDHVNELFPKIRKTSYRHDDHDPNGRRAGRVAAEKADLGGKKVSDANRPRLEA